MRITIAVTVVVLSLTGCGWRKQHLIQGYGQSYDTAFAAQRERRDKAPAEAAIGLDAQEAAIISDGYRRGLAPSSAEGAIAQQPIILMSPEKSGQPYVPPPSVPRD